MQNKEQAKKQKLTRIIPRSVLQNLKTQREKLNRRIQKMEAFAKVQARKQDVRRKILIGAYYLDQATKNGATQELKKAMEGFLKRESDKKLFDEAF